ncbi:MAG: TIGR01906 family membrane protein [Dehalococcoidia bacterium]|nr:TIGR01906 family membrane protein [Dehalococcoidia bacterium]
MANTAAAVITLCLPLFLTATVLRAEINEPRLYHWSISQPQVLNITGISQTELEQACRRLIAYFNLEVASPQMEVTRHGTKVPLFTERELLHLEDVRDLVQLDYRIGKLTGLIIATCLVIILLTPRPARKAGAALLCGSSLTLVLTSAFAIASIADFDWLFWQFHVVSFSNLLWQLDPAHHHLIQMFPQRFWYAAAMIAIGLITVCAIGILVLGRWLVRSAREIPR